jgi:hypothetical protein
MALSKKQIDLVARHLENIQSLIFIQHLIGLLVDIIQLREETLFFKVKNVYTTK